MGENSQDNTQNGAPAGGLQKKTKIAYGVGAVGKDMVYMLVASYILYYYNSVLGVSSVFIGTVLMVARVFDAFNDPIMGIVVAKTRSRWGRFRPWIFSGTVLNAVVLGDGSYPHSKSGKHNNRDRNQSFVSPSVRMSHPGRSAFPETHGPVAENP